LVDSSILIEDRSVEPNEFSLIPLNNGDEHIPEWLPPLGEVAKATVVGIACENENGDLSEKSYRTYFVGLDDFASQ